VLTDRLTAAFYLRELTYIRIRIESAGRRVDDAPGP
jgi:hypothetical protein